MIFLLDSDIIPSINNAGSESPVRAGPGALPLRHPGAGGVLPGQVSAGLSHDIRPHPASTPGSDVQHLAPGADAPAPGDRALQSG